MNTSARLSGWKRNEFFEWILHRIGLHAVFSSKACHIIHLTAAWYSHKSWQSYIRSESYNFAFRHVCFVSRISRHNSSEPLFSYRKPGWFSYMTPRWNFSRKQSGQPGSCEEAFGTTLRGGSRKLRKERWGNVSALPAIIMLGIIIRFWETAHLPLP